MQITDLDPLFRDVQLAQAFADDKVFVDCTPLRPLAEIASAYSALAPTKPDRQRLRHFVNEHFILPPEDAIVAPAALGGNICEHLHNLWDVLRREPDMVIAGSTLLSLPGSYIVPGGRFREIYYWDSYFTMLGLRESGREDLIESMVGNFAHLIETYGLIPNGNRSYYLSRSQPPFFALMVEFLAERNGDCVYRTYGPALEKEYAYWMDETAPTRHVVHLPDGSRLNRYYDQKNTARPEAFATDEATSRGSAQERTSLFRNIRSAAESGWDFSSRWFADGRTLATIETTEIVPVDLNCLLFQLERTLANAYCATGNRPRAEAMIAAAELRRRALIKTCWSETERFFFDYHIGHGQPSLVLTLAGVTPLFIGLATPAQANAVADTLRRRFLRAGGVVTSLCSTGQQWDAPNGWAPLQWMTVSGLVHYGHLVLAEDIAKRWITLNRNVYKRTGKMMEKYNVEDTTLTAGGGEYRAQDGFGWTNGVLLALLRMYPDADPCSEESCEPDSNRKPVR